MLRESQIGWSAPARDRRDGHSHRDQEAHAVSEVSGTHDRGRDASIDREVDGICDRFEEAWKTGLRPVLEDHLAEVPEPIRPVLLRELLAVEIPYRRRAGETPTRSEYQARFPEHAATLAAILEETSVGAMESDPGRYPGAGSTLPGTSDDPPAGPGRRRPGPRLRDPGRARPGRDGGRLQGRAAPPQPRCAPSR